MRRLVHVLFGGIPTSPVASRALMATIADWRHEAEAASSAGRRLRVALVGSAAVARVLVGVSLKELPGAWKEPFLWRTAIVLLLFVAAMVMFNPPERFSGVLIGWDLTALATVTAFRSVFLVLPLVAFVSEVTGQQSRQAPCTGAFTLMTIAIAAMVSVLPEFMTFQAQVTWAHFANAATPAPLPLPSAYRLVVGGPMAPVTVDYWLSLGTMFVVLSAATVGLSTLAYQVRKRRGLRAWLIGVAPFVAVPATVYGVMILTGLLGFYWRDVALWAWPIRGLVVLFSVTVLPLILAAHLARDTHSRAIKTDSEATL